MVLNWGCQHHQGVQDSVLKGVKKGSRKKVIKESMCQEKTSNIKGHRKHIHTHRPIQLKKIGNL